jgi:GH15 family glucan-1,4-alpha-glucosidase
LYADGAVVGLDGMPQSVEVGVEPTWTVADLVQDLWVAEGTVPGPEGYAELAEQALRDLDALVLPSGAAVAGLSDDWRYVWPRDASFVAAALARTGHQGDAYQVLEYLQTLQTEGSVDGVFHARYLPDGSGAVPDDRGTQLDGSGWVLWAVATWYTEAVDADADADAGTQAALAALRPLVTRSVAAIRANVGLDGLPTVSPDYWEVSETDPSLGTAAALLLGLRSVGPVLVALGEPPVDDVVAALDQGIAQQFAPTYGRHPGDWARDTAVAFLMPPFAPADDDVTAAWAAAARAMARPAGGLAPGVAWRQDGVSWTPTTAMFALTAAASGDRDRARTWLDWLAAHRTARGSLPEKVLWDGSASAVAPLAWTCALVLLALDELDDLALAPEAMEAA